MNKERGANLGTAGLAQATEMYAMTKLSSENLG